MQMQCAMELVVSLLWSQGQRLLCLDWPTSSLLLPSPKPYRNQVLEPFNTNHFQYRSLSSSKYSVADLFILRISSISSNGALSALISAIHPPHILKSSVSSVAPDTSMRSGKFDAALEILDHMEELGTSLELNTYNSVLVALVKKNQEIRHEV
ncbi:Pentatricopeptide repeat-containing protein, partial [Cucurbita argyrosperma subsp. sororia]